MNLHTLDAGWNPNITDNGIKHMKLTALYASSRGDKDKFGCNITDK